MDYFSDQLFPLCGSIPDYRGFTSNYPIYYGIQYNHSGKLSLSVDHGPARIVEGPCVFLTHPGRYFEYTNGDGKTRHHCFLCSCGERIQHYIDGGLMELNPDPVLTRIANPERFLRTMLEIISLLKKSVLPPPRAVLLYEDLLLQIQESRLQEKNSLPPWRKDGILKLAEKIRLNPEREYDFRKEAEAFHVTDTHFRRIFRQVCGVPPLKYLLHKRLEKAASLLLSTDSSIAEAGELAGVPNRYYFSKLFKEKYRITPLEYRREFK